MALMIQYPNYFWKTLVKFRQIVGDHLVKDEEKLSPRLCTLKEGIWNGGTAPHIFNLGIRLFEQSALLSCRCTLQEIAAGNQLLRMMTTMTMITSVTI
jgi:hypothetical protein